MATTVLVNGGTAVVSGRLTGAASPSQVEPKNIGWGTGAGTSAVANTTLFTETAVDLSTTSGTRLVGASSQVTTTLTNDTYQVTGTLTATGAGTVTNAGLFDGTTIGSNTLFVKGDFTGIPLAISDSISFTFKCKILPG